MEEEFPIRLCYHGNTFINDSEYQGKLKEYTQIGAELVCEDSTQADAEIIVMLIESLLESGLKDFRVEIGEAGFFHALVSEAGLDRETEDCLRETIEIKNYFEIEKIIEPLTLNKELKTAFRKLPELFGSVSVLSDAKQITSNVEALRSIEKLENLYSLLKLYNLEEYVVFDFGVLGQYQYYTGIVFKAFTYGAGDTIVTGGRYNNLLKQFGKNAPSVGFAINIDQLMTVLNRQGIIVSVDYDNKMILYTEAEQRKAIEYSKQLRHQGTSVEMILLDKKKTVQDYLVHGKSTGIDEVILFENGEKKIFEVKV
jgi:ATP phosphoribosyltransferase regulatory subunit